LSKLESGKDKMFILNTLKYKFIHKISLILQRDQHYVMLQFWLEWRQDY